MSTRDALASGAISLDHAAVVARSVGNFRRKPVPTCGERPSRCWSTRPGPSIPRTWPDWVAACWRWSIRSWRIGCWPGSWPMRRPRPNGSGRCGCTRTRTVVSTWLRGKLDPVTTEMLRTALEPLAKPMPTTADGPDPRSPSQRLGDGFAELLRRYLNAGASPTQGGEKPHVVITSTTTGWSTAPVRERSCTPGPRSRRGPHKCSPVTRRSASTPPALAGKALVRTARR